MSEKTVNFLVNCHFIKTLNFLVNFCKLVSDKTMKYKMNHGIFLVNFLKVEFSLLTPPMGVVNCKLSPLEDAFE